MPKTALITGGSSGLGLELARNLHRQGYALILLARDPQRLARAKATLEQDGGAPVSVYDCDVGDEARMSEVFADLKRQDTTIDFLVINAAVVSVELLTDYRTLEEVTHELKVNLLGAVTTAYLGSRMLVRGSRVLFISSGFGLVGAPGYSLYATAKGGMNNFADALRRELLPRGISVHVACPGDIDTPMLERERSIMPDWIKEKTGRGKPRSAPDTADEILQKCFQGQYVIIPSHDVQLLVLIQKLLPRFLSTYVIDRILPRAPALPARSG